MTLRNKKFFLFLFSGLMKIFLKAIKTKKFRGNKVTDSKNPVFMRVCGVTRCENGRVTKGNKGNDMGLRAL